MNIGENIKAFRKALNMEQKDLAERLHISHKTISSWECGRTEPKMGMIEEIAKAFGVSKTDLINGQIYESFNTGAEFEKKWNDLGGGKHPIDLTDDEYTLIINYRASDESAKDTFKRMLAYASKMRELK